MAWVAIENFNSYSDGNLSFNNGGSGWSAAWGGGSDNEVFDVQATQVYEGAKAIENITTAEATIERDLTTSVSAGKWYFAMRSSSNSVGLIYLTFRDSVTANIFHIRLDSNGYIRHSHEGQAATNLMTYNADQWYVIEVDFIGGSTDTVDVRIHDGNSWNGPYNKSTYASGGNITRVTMGRGAAGTFNGYWDIITPTNPVVDFIPKILST